MLKLSVPLPSEITVQRLICEAKGHFDSGHFKISYERYIEALHSAVEELGKLRFINERTCLNFTEQIYIQCKKKTPPPLPAKPRSLSTSLPRPRPPLPVKNNLNAKSVTEKKTRKGPIKNPSDNVTNTKPRQISSPKIPTKLISTYNKDLFLSSVNQVQVRVQARSITDQPLVNSPWIPQPPFDFISHTLKKQQKFDPSFEKLRTLQSFHVISILQFCPGITAYQLTLIEAAIFDNITLQNLKDHKPKSPEDCILASINFFNYLTRFIEHSILLKLSASDRARHVNYWIKVAFQCHELRNYQTLKAIISALGTPPMQRLKQSWAFVPKKSMQQLEELTETMSESSNYEKYRQILSVAQFSEPMVPFLGLFLHDITYLCALKGPTRTRESELTVLFTEIQKTPSYSLSLPALYAKEVSSYNRPKFSLRYAVRKGSLQEDHTKLSLDLQQCLVSQYLLTRPWVNEKTVDELCLLREPSKVNTVLASSTSLTTTGSSSASLASNSLSSSRPVSLEEEEAVEVFDRNPIYWLFGRKSVDHSAALKPDISLHRSLRHFSFDDINEEHKKKTEENGHHNQSLAIFRKDFWKQQKSTIGTFNSDPFLSVPNVSSPHPLDKEDYSNSSVWT
ncbi:ras guanine nucleotide exchange factor domain-containing protein [Sporodiniella umbellata]|nr:ras guanine nucleotide exchange factor domain-containing protein [Sporodiniella umbellata]